MMLNQFDNSIKAVNFVSKIKINKMNKNDLTQKLLLEIPLKSKLQVLNEMYFIDLLTELGYRKDEMWSPDESDRLTKLCHLAEKLADIQMEEIENHKTLNK